MSRILVTGSSGFIGKHLVERLQKSGVEVVPFDLVENKKNDITIYDNIKETLDSNIDGVIHLAAVSSVRLGNEFPLSCMVINVVGTLNILESIKTCSRTPWIILISSKECESPSNVYGLSKLTCESLGKIYAIKEDMRVLVLRLSDTYGEGQSTSKVLPIFVSRALKGEELVVENSGKSLDLVRVEEVVDTIIKSANYLIAGGLDGFQIWNTYSGAELSITDLAELVVEELNSSSKITKVVEHKELRKYIKEYGSNKENLL